MLLERTGFVGLLGRFVGFMGKFVGLLGRFVGFMGKFVGLLGRFVGFMGKFVGILRGSLVFRAIRWNIG